VVDEHAETETDEEAMLRLSTAEQARLLLAEAGITDPEPDLRVDPDDEIQPAPATLEFVAPAGRQVSPETARATLQAQLDLWRAEHRETFQPRDFAEIRARVGRSRAWVHQELNRLEREGLIEGLDNGRYRFVMAGVS